MPTTELAKLLVRSRVDWCRVRATLAVRGRVSVAVRARAGASTRSEVRQHSQRRHVWSPEAVMIRCFPGTHTRSNMALWCACHSVRKWPATKTSNVCRLERARAKWAQPCGCSHAYASGGAACAQGRRLAAGQEVSSRASQSSTRAPRRRPRTTLLLRGACHVKQRDDALLVSDSDNLLCSGVGTELGAEWRRWAEVVRIAQTVAAEVVEQGTSTHCSASRRCALATS